MKILRRIVKPRTTKRGKWNPRSKSATTRGNATLISNTFPYLAMKTFYEPGFAKEDSGEEDELLVESSADDNENDNVFSQNSIEEEDSGKDGNGDGICRNRRMSSASNRRMLLEKRRRSNFSFA